MAEELKLGQGSRKNDNKPRFDLLEPFAQLQKAQIFTKGAKKYANHNWLQGMSWSKCYASGMRHAQAFWRGEDRDIDPNCSDCKKGLEGPDWICTNHTGELHSALAAWNFDALTSYYKFFPQGDDRIHTIVPEPKIGLDIDEVICDWVPDWIKFWRMDVPTSWFFDYDILSRFDSMKEMGTLDDFYLKLKPKCKPSDIPFEPHCYVTSRPIDTEITKQWLKKHGFPLRPVITVPPGVSKLETIRKAGIDIFVDDRYDTFEELNRNGICCYLFDAPHNHRYDVGYRRIKSLKELAR